METKIDVLGLGAVAVDDVIGVEQYPPVDTKEAIRSHERFGGGLAGTSLVTASRLGCRAAYCGSLGDDDLSLFTLREFEREGVDCTWIARIPGARPIHSIVIVEQTKGTRTLFFDLSGLRPPPEQLLTADLVRRSRVLFIDHTLPDAAQAGARLARQAGIPVVADLERGRDESLSDLLPWIDHLVIGIEMGKQLTGESEPHGIVSRLLEQGQPMVVVTKGDQGCWYGSRPTEVYHQPALPVAVLDTLGCGDVFHGAYAAGLSRGLEATLIVRTATTAAGLKATRSGGRAGIPTWDAVQRHLKLLELPQKV
jgi:sugar/nucleoside kinase (ribokinase family)